MKKIAYFAGLSIAALAAAGAPSVGWSGGSIQHGAPRDEVRMDQPFHLTGFDYRIHAMRWIASDSAFAGAVAPYAKAATAPNGDLVFTVPVRNVQSGEAGAPGLDVTAIYKDGTSATSDETPFAKDGSPLTAANVQPGQGKTMYYAITNVPKPSHSNPVVKLILRYAANNDPGFPDTYYLFDPSLGR